MKLEFDTEAQVLFIYSFIVLFHVLEHVGHFKAIENNPGKRLGPRIYSWPLPP